MVDSEELCTQLKASGRRLTPQRRAIIEALLEELSHPTADEILSRVRRRMPDISHATVYNTLRELAEIGVIRELEVGLSERHYDLPNERHAHLVCRACGELVDVVYDRRAETLRPVDNHGFEIDECLVVFRGRCPRCTP